MARPTGCRFMHAAIFICVIIWCSLFIKIIPNQIGGLTFDESVASIATRYGLDGLGIESRGERDFPHPSRPALWPT